MHTWRDLRVRGWRKGKGETASLCSKPSWRSVQSPMRPGGAVLPISHPRESASCNAPFLALVPHSPCATDLYALTVALVLRACNLIGAPPPSRPYQPYLSLARVRADEHPGPSAADASRPQTDPQGGPISSQRGQSNAQATHTHIRTQRGGQSSTQAVAAEGGGAFSASDRSAAARQFWGLYRSSSALLPLAAEWRAARLCVISRYAADSDHGGFVVKR